jgi:hypothetical protein
MPKAITVIEIFSSKPMMHMNTYIMIPGHKLGIFKNAEYFLLRQYIMIDLQINTIESNCKSVTSRKHC